MTNKNLTMKGITVIFEKIFNKLRQESSKYRSKKSKNVSQAGAVHPSINIWTEAAIGDVL